MHGKQEGITKSGRKRAVEGGEQKRRKKTKKKQVEKDTSKQIRQIRVRAVKVGMKCRNETQGDALGEATYKKKEKMKKKRQKRTICSRVTRYAVPVAPRNSKPPSGRYI